MYRPTNRWVKVPACIDVRRCATDSDMDVNFEGEH